VTLIALLARNQGGLSDAWSLLLRQAFGVGSYPAALLMIVGGLVLLFWTPLRGRYTLRWQTVVGGELCFFAGLGLLHVMAREPAWELAQSGRYGGYIGWAWWQLLVPLFGEGPSILMLATLTLVGVYLGLGVRWRWLIWRLRHGTAQLGARIRSARTQRQGEPPGLLKLCPPE